MMHCFIFLIVAQSAAAHYVFSKLILRNRTTEDWKYVRNVAPEDNSGYYAKMDPQFDIYSSNITCGRNAFDSAAKTQTAHVAAGQTIGFALGDDSLDTDPAGSYLSIFHPGPVQIYISSPPSGDLTTYKGDGDWVKIASLAAKNDEEWVSYRQSSANFTIPATTPPGKYLLRIEQFMPTSGWNYTQWYVNCAHITVVGPGGGDIKSAGTAKFPGTYDIMDPGLWIPAEMDGFPKAKGLLKYQAPGPAVWKG